jgi:signal peptidase I
MPIEPQSPDESGRAGSPQSPIPRSQIPQSQVPEREVPQAGSPEAGASDPPTSPGPPQPQGLHRHRTGSRPKRAKAPWWELPLLVVIAVVVAMLIKTFLLQPYYIPSESMEKTLHGCTGCSGDRILVNKPIFDLRDPHPGDVVVFKAPDGWDDEPAPIPPNNPILKGVRWIGQLVGLVPPDENDLVKRVIAIGGQTVQCCDSQGRVQVSDFPGEPFRSLDEPFVYQDLPWDPADKPGQPPAGDDQRTFGPVTLPAGRLWVMGDHRSVSADSRYRYAQLKSSVADSTVPTSAVIGKAVLIVWPPSRWRTLGTPTTFKQLAAGIGGSGAPMLGAGAVVLPGWVRRRRRRR